MNNAIFLGTILTLISILAGIGCMFLIEIVKDAIKGAKGKKVNDILVDPEAIDTLDPAVLVRMECEPLQSKARKEAWKKINKSIKDSFSSGEPVYICSLLYKNIPYELLMGTLENAGYSVVDVCGMRFAKSDYDIGYRMYLRIKEEER